MIRSDYATTDQSGTEEETKNFISYQMFRNVFYKIISYFLLKLYKYIQNILWQSKKKMFAIIYENSFKQIEGFVLVKEWFHYTIIVFDSL